MDHRRRGGRGDAGSRRSVEQASRGDWSAFIGLGPWRKAMPTLNSSVQDYKIPHRFTPRVGAGAGWGSGGDPHVAEPRVSRAASASTAAATSAPASSRSRKTTSPSFRGPSRPDVPVAPHRGAGVAVGVEQGLGVLAEVPVPPLPAHGRRVERRQQGDPRRRRRRGPRSSASTTPGAPSRSTSPRRAGQRLADLAHAQAAPPLEVGDGADRMPQPAPAQLDPGLVGVGRWQAGGSHDDIGAHRYWLLVHLPWAGPAPPSAPTTAGTAPGWSTRQCPPTCSTPTSSCYAWRPGTSFESSAPVASPRRRSSPRSRLQLLQTARPRPCRRPRSCPGFACARRAPRRRCTRPARRAPWHGRTNIVRRIQSVRTSRRSSYSALSRGSTPASPSGPRPTGTPTTGRCRARPRRRR